MGYNDLRDIAPVLQGACMLIWTEYSCNVFNPFRCTQLYSKTGHEATCPSSRALWKQATEDLANEEASGACSPGGMHAYMDRVFMQCFLNPFRCTQLYSKNRPRSKFARLQELWWKQATEDLANEEAKWMYTVVLEKQATKQLARLQELWWKQATEDLANEEAKWVKLKDKKLHVHSCTRKTGHEANLARLQELWWKQATEDLANEEAKWMYTVVLEKQATKQLARLQELWWKQATEDLANEEAKWVKLKDKKKLHVHSCTRKQATKQLARLQELWWKQATEDLANEEAKWMYTVVLEKQATKQLARLQELWWKQATEDLANEEAKWMYTVVLEKQATKQLARLQELWWKQATEDLANEEAKWVKLKDKKASYRIRKGN
ncbi:hypothetical protein TNCV_3694851 [Trichonephila clavipes]|nr:hypothetical protein TNCV_3694851 [Trichonephila clavipes]